VHEGKGINTPKDLKGRTVSVMAYQDTTYYVLLGMLAAAGLQRATSTRRPAGPAGVWQLFAAGKTDAMSAVPEMDSPTRAPQAPGSKIYESDQSFNSMAQVGDRFRRHHPQAPGPRAQGGARDAQGRARQS
jgi:NitT/TauT family transport system substrate-binding protein